MTAIHPRALAAAGLLSLGALLLTGCSSSPAKGATAQPSSSGNAQNSAYRTCLSQHGITLPTGRPSGGFSRNPSRNPSDRPSRGAGNGGGYGGGGFGFGGASANPSMQAAMQACASLRPTGGFGGRGAGGTAMAAFTSCMKDHGVTLPANNGFRNLNTADPKTAAAYTICKALLPARGGNGGGGNGGAPGATPAPSAS